MAAKTISIADKWGAWSQFRRDPKIAAENGLRWCEHCEREDHQETTFHHGTRLSFCSVKCMVRELEKREFEARHDL